MEQQLLLAIGALWAALTAGAAWAGRFLLDDRKTAEAAWAARLVREEERCNERIGRLETKLDESATVIREQTAAAHKQIDAQGLLIAQQQQMIEALQALGKAPPA
jgi:hypothetical protein